MNTLIQSREFSMPLGLIAGGGIPSEIQWMPPGEHVITTNGEDGPRTDTVHVDAKTAERLQAQLEQMKAKAEAGEDDLPFIDFNHDDRESAGRPLAFRWGGDDPKTGGVIVAVEWSGAGKAALEQKNFRRFSPSFFLNAAGEVTGAPVNMGGLVNRAAFKKINPIIAGQPTGQPPEHMDDKEKEKMVARLAALEAENADLKKKISDSESEEEMKAKDAEIAKLSKQLDDLKAADVERVKIEAKSAVADAVAQGRIAPQDKEAQESLTSLYETNPAATKAIIAKMPVNPALATVVPSGSAPGGTPGVTADTAEDYAATVQAKFTELKAKHSDAEAKSRAISAAIEAKPKAYAAWRAKNGEPGLAFA